MNLLGEAAAATSYDSLVQPMSSARCGGSQPAVAGEAAEDGRVSGLAGRVRQLMMQPGQGRSASSSRGNSSGGRQASQGGGSSAGAGGGAANAVGHADAGDGGGRHLACIKPFATCRMMYCRQCTKCCQCIASSQCQLQHVILRQYWMR